MTYLHRSLLAISIALVALLAALVVRSIPRQIDALSISDAELQFGHAPAYEYAKELASRYPERAMGTGGSRASAEWIQAEMEKLGLAVEMQPFSGWIHGAMMSGRNVIGVDRGVSDKMIVVVAHYDIPFHVREGAMDDASGVGVLLELARVFAHEEQEKTLVFAASDGEEWGMLGARHFVQSHSAPQKIIAAVSLDYARLEAPEKVYVRGEGQFKRYASLWLWVLAQACIENVNGEAGLPTPAMHYVNRAVDISSTDQGPFVAAGIPAINLGGNKAGSPLARKIYHTALDTHENLKPELFLIYGRAAELLVRSLDVLDYSPEDEPYFLPLGERSYLGGHALRALHISLFFPLLLATLFQYYSIRTNPAFPGSVLVEVFNFGLFIFPWLTAILVLRALVAMNYVPKFELYPATPLDPLLYRPAWGAIAISACTFFVGWALVVLVRRLVPALTKPDFNVTRAVGLDLLLSTSAVALALNGFAATLFLAPAALLWMWIERGRSPVRLALNVVLLVLGAVPFLLLLIHFSENLRLGWHVCWYMYLGVAYRFFSPAAVFIAVAVATVGGRFIQQSICEMKTGAELEAAKDELVETHV